MFFLDPFLFMIITSKSNKTVSFVNSLKNKKARKENNAYLVEGKKMVREAFAANQPVESVIVSESAVVDFDTRGVDPIVVSDAIFDYLSDEVTPQGFLAVVSRKRERDFDIGDVSILLDGVSDPGNMGTIIRTAVAVGVKTIFAVNCCDPYSPKTVRSSMSGIYHVDIVECTHDKAFDLLGDTPIIVADMGGVNVFGFEPPKRFCLVVGNEANGVSEIVRNRSAYTVKIPMSDKTESLNAAVSLAVTLYELTEGKNNSLIKA